MKVRSILAGVVMTALAGCASVSSIGNPKITVEAIAYSRLGEGVEGLRLSDREWEAVIVPAIGGRVMRFGRVGGENWLWENPALRKIQPPSQKDWVNYGGEKTWPWPQDAWEKTWGRGWPPAFGFDQSAFRVERIANGLRLVGPAQSGPGVVGSGVRVVREVTLLPGGKLRVLSRLEAIGAGSLVEMSPWTVTQLTWPDEARGVEMRGIEGEAKDFRLDGNEWKDRRVEGDVLTLGFKEDPGLKVGGDAKEVVWRSGGRSLSQRIVSCTPGRKQAGESLQVYKSGRGPTIEPGNYIEIEVTAPTSLVLPDRPVELLVEWTATAP